MSASCWDLHVHLQFNTFMEVLTVQLFIQLVRSGESRLFRDSPFAPDDLMKLMTV